MSDEKPVVFSDLLRGEDMAELWKELVERLRVAETKLSAVNEALALAHRQRKYLLDATKAVHAWLDTPNPTEDEASAILCLKSAIRRVEGE